MPSAWPTVAARAARRKAAVVWWLRPWWRGRGSASDVRAATTGRPPRAAAASTIGATSSAVVPELDAGADHAGSHGDDDHVGAGDAHREVDGGRHGDGLELAAEGVARR